jgi:hypothetical protein
MHVILRTRPDVVAQWSDEEVARRWLSLFPGQRVDEFLGQPTQNCIDALVNEAGLLACSMYVDLNPIRAAMAQTPEESVHTSAYDRIGAMEGEKVESAAADTVVIPTEEAGRIGRTSTPDQLRERRAKARQPRRGRSILKDAWLAPLTLDERGKPGEMVSDTKIRASDKVFLTMSLADYLSLLKWTARNKPSLGKAEATPEVEPILKRLGIDGSVWIDLVWKFKKYYQGSVAGLPDSMAAHAAARPHRWRRGQRAVRRVFASPA